ncbi:MULTISPECIES: recombinase family protein [unclassified Aerococcus]|uniref:recombinase family protein n=1 Tax=unclassified Aerococcus TaxID=2618060 RepID=UPI0008A4A5A4|nr:MULTISPECIES: recombinase family protein [unclassified Aerococcus]MDK6679213.1 recombinase family protein [Aerococcus sp. UMB8608]MDK6685945.1 recombinase family protein [Aerococcus sp. UMB8623]MDK6940749.1 recombinase family protein [Aerococcus sp. UMB8487]OFK21277.1 resolvase [Aerococcus sp. HMSC072A12]OFR32567.1 resolvase [Aerococcus sp. HMSC061A03]
MIYGYARVSTYHQDLQNQVQLLEDAGCEEIYKEKMTGTNINRNEFNKLLKIIQSGDTLVVTKLDRFARSTSGALEVIEKLFASNVTVHVLNMGVIDNTPTGRLIFTIFSAFAEFERDLIVERTREGKEIAKLNPNYREGRPRKYSNQQIEHALELLKSNTYEEVRAMTGISKSTLIRYKRKSNQSIYY